MIEMRVRDLKPGDVITMAGVGSARVTQVDPQGLCYPGLWCVIWEHLDGQPLSHDHLSPHQVVGEKVSELSDHLEWAWSEWNQAWNEREEGELPRMEVTQEQYEIIREHGYPWTDLPDGQEMWGGVVVEVVDE